MKLKIILIISIGLNVALGMGYLAKNRQSSVEGASDAGAGTNGLLHLAGKKAGTQVVTNEVAHKFDWRLVESEDYKKYIANLRSIGCPEETIRDIIIADVNKLFESRAKELKPKQQFKYWQTGMQMFSGIMDEEKIKQQQALSQEKRALLKELLGVEPEEKMDLNAMFGGANPFEAMLDFLTPAKQTKVMEIYQKYQARAMKTFSNGSPDAEDMKEVRKVKKEMDAELAGVLTPEEKDGFDLRMSDTAMSMRMQLTGFEPSEQEFKEMFKLKKKFDDDYGDFDYGTSDKAEQEKRKTAEEEMKSQMKQSLGEGRYAEYERAQDYTYQGIAKVVERQGLPKESAVKVYDMKKAVDEQVKALRADKTKAKEDRTAALQQIRNETERSMREVLGDAGFQSYQKQAHWLNQISPAVKSE
ncbi:MAG: hypothetical protein JWQ71_3945 [Pedosphaera sp.]|nr:hypothetical protein [Pedosphaera sp.]